MAALGSLVADYSDSESDSDPITLVSKLLRSEKLPRFRLLHVHVDLDLDILVCFTSRLKYSNDKTYVLSAIAP